MVLDDLKKISPAELANLGVIVPALRQGYVCPACGSGQRENGTGLSVKRYDWGNHYHCFSCGAKFSAVDLVGEYLKVDARSREGLSAIVKWSKEQQTPSSFIRKTQPAKTATTSKSVQKPKADTADTPKADTAESAKDFRKFYYYAQKKLESYLADHENKIRGLTGEILKSAGAGISTHTGSNKNWLVLPYDNCRYFKRELEGRGKYFTTGQARSLYDPCNAFAESSELVFVVEGEINCLSLIQAGYNAVAVGGVANYEKLAEWLTALNLKHKPTIFLLPDDFNALNEIYHETCNALDSAGFTKWGCYCFDEKDKGSYDINDALKRYGERKLKILIERILREGIWAK